MLVTLNDVKNNLGISLSNTDNDSFLNEQIVVVSDAIELYCGRVFAQTTYTQTFYRDEMGHNVKDLYLYHYPLISLTSVMDESDTLMVDYRINKPTARLHHPQGWFNGNKEVEAIFVAGYASIPSLIKSVVYTLVGERYSKKLAGVDMNFGSDVQRISLPGTLSIDFDYTLQNNEAKSALGVILGSQVNILNQFKTERKVCGILKETYVS